MTHTQLEAIAVADILVVMDQGRIEQAASPNTIYNTPRTAYVARFIGGQNVLSGKVEGVADGTIRRDRIEVVKAAGNFTDMGEVNVVRGKPFDRVPGLLDGAEILLHHHSRRAERRGYLGRHVVIRMRQNARARLEDLDSCTKGVEDRGDLQPRVPAADHQHRRRDRG